MTEIHEGDLEFTFPDHCEADKYDEWSFYRNQFNSVAGGSKAVDILCVSVDAARIGIAKRPGLDETRRQVPGAGVSSRSISSIGFA